MHHQSFLAKGHIYRPGFPCPHGVGPVPDQLKALVIWRWATGAWPFPNLARKHTHTHTHTHTQHWSIGIEVSQALNILRDIERFIFRYFSHVALVLLFNVAPLQIAALEAAAAAVVNALRLDNFAPGCAENPKLQRHYAAIQALGLTGDTTWYRMEPDGKHERLRTIGRMLLVPHPGQEILYIFFADMLYDNIAYTYCIHLLHTVFRLAWDSEGQGWIRAANLESRDIIMPQCASAISESECQRRLLCKTHGPFGQDFRCGQGDASDVRAMRNSLIVRLGPYGDETNFRALESTESVHVCSFLAIINLLGAPTLDSPAVCWLIMTHPDCEDLIRFLELPYSSGPGVSTVIWHDLTTCRNHHAFMAATIRRIACNIAVGLLPDATWANKCRSFDHSKLPTEEYDIVWCSCHVWLIFVKSQVGGLEMSRVYGLPLYFLCLSCLNYVYHAFSIFWLVSSTGCHPGGLDSLTLKTDGLVGTQSGLHRPVFIFDLESDVPDPERRSLALQPASTDRWWIGWIGATSHAISICIMYHLVALK